MAPTVDSHTMFIELKPVFITLTFTGNSQCLPWERKKKKCLSTEITQSFLNQTTSEMIKKGLVDFPQNLLGHILLLLLSFTFWAFKCGPLTSQGSVLAEPSGPADLLLTYMLGV